MRLASIPTAFLQVFSFANTSFRLEVARRKEERKQIRDHLVEVGEVQLLFSLDRCEKAEAGIIGAFAFLGVATGYIFKSPTVGIMATLAGIVLASVLSGIMVDNVYGLSRLVSNRTPR